MTKNTNRQYAKALFEATKNLKGEKLYKVLEKFAGILARDHKLKQSKNIIREFVKYIKIGEGIKEIQITTARELDIKTINKIKDVFGNNVEATVSIDPSLLGGVRIRTEDKILDASLQTQLLKLKQIIA